MTQLVLTACNDKYYDSCLTLIASIHRTSYDTVDIILVYSLGLTIDNIKNLNNIEKVNVISMDDIPDEINGINIDKKWYIDHPTYFGWKSCFIMHAMNYGDKIFYIVVLFFLKTYKKYSILLKTMMYFWLKIIIKKIMNGHTMNVRNC